MGIHVISMCAILAIIPLYWLPVLPDLHLVWLLIAAGIALSVQQRKWLRFSGLALLFMCWGILAAQESVWPMNYLTQAPQQAEVVITATDGATMHQGKIVSLNG
ncbi:ComEC family protein, partial [Escherichia coli]|nr:ComEC family protein [Escherichia coli]